MVGHPSNSWASYCFCCRTVAVDMRGFGDSDKPRGICEYTLDILVSDINQLITVLGLFDYQKNLPVCHAVL